MQPSRRMISSGRKKGEWRGKNDQRRYDDYEYNDKEEEKEEEQEEEEEQWRNGGSYRKKENEGKSKGECRR